MEIQKIRELWEYYFDRPYEFVCDLILESDKTGIYPTPQQELVLRAIQEGSKHIAVKAGHGVGKCFGIGTEILMYDGSIRKVETIKSGDLVMGWDGSPRKAIGIARGSSNMFRIEYSDGSGYVVNEEHILSLVATQTHGKQKKGDKTNISVKEYLKWSDRKKRTNVGYKVAVEYPKKNLKIDPYILGVWLGDGSSKRPEITNIDPEIIEYWTKEANRRNLKIRKNDSTYAFSSGRNGGHVQNNFTSDLKSYGLLGNKHIPFDYLTTTKKDRLELLAGLIDTDGNIQGNGRVFCFINKNEMLAKDVLRLAQSVGCHATYHKKKKFCTSKGQKVYGTYHEICITRNIDAIPVRVDRKKPHGKTQRSNLHFRFDIIPLGIGNYYGFELEGKDKLFLLADHTVVHNTGLESWVLTWFMATRPHSKVPCTAPTQAQLFDVLWSEAQKWISQIKFEPLKEMFECTQTHIYNKYAPETWFAVAKSCKKKENLQGFHGREMLFIIDEASGVPQDIMEVVQGALTNEGAMCLMMGNPTQVSGAFYDAFHKDREFWKTFTFSSADSPLVAKDYVERMKSKYGENSNVFKVRVLGEFPDNQDDALIPLSWAEAASNNELEDNSRLTTYIGVDVARFGDDKTVICVRRGNKILKMESFAKQSTMETVGYVVLEANKHKKNEVIINIDDSGVGGGVTDRLNELLGSERQIYINPVNNGASPDDEKFRNLGMEIWWNMRENIRSWQIPKDEELISQLCTRKYAMTSMGKLELERKEEMKKRGLSSPDKADALALAFFDTKKSSGAIVF